MSGISPAIALSTDLDAKVAFLRRSDAYPDLPRRVEAVETHLSWVFLTDERAYKLKKPVRRDLVDFSTVDGRRLNCEEEVRLNRRLAPQVYLGLVPLTLQPGGFALHGGGEVVDWLVVMRRLPRDATLEHRIRSGTVRVEEVARIMYTLGAFYRDAPRAALSGREYAMRCASAVTRDRHRLLNPDFGLLRDEVSATASALLTFVDQQPEPFVRAAERVVEAHGDLRPEHIFLLPSPTIIDCLEFSRDLRLLDPAEELAYLGLECAALGAPWITAELFRCYSQSLGVALDERLLRFYRGSRGLLRARLAVEHLADPIVRTPEKWRKQTATYLKLAGEASRAL